MSGGRQKYEIRNLKFEWRSGIAQKIKVLRIRRLVLAGVTIAYGMLLCGCGQQRTDSVVRLTLEQPRTFDSRRSDDVALSSIMYQIGEGLTSLDENGRAVPAAASGWEHSGDYRAYTFTIRDDTRWSDGALLTATDFAETWLDILDNKFASDRAELLFSIRNAREFNRGLVSRRDVGITTPDSRTLKVEFGQPRPYFAEEVATSIFFPVPASRHNQDGYFKNPAQIVSNGPFKINDYTRDARLVLVRNANYHDSDKVRPDRVEFVFVTDANAQYAMLLNGQVDLINGYPARQYPDLLSRGYIRKFVRSGIYSYIINVKRAPLNDVRVRQALALALDRKEITGNVTVAGEIPLAAVVPYGLPDAGGGDFRKNGGALFADGDVVAARKLLAAAGYPDGKGFPEVTLNYNSSDMSRSVAEAAQEMWKKNLNIRVQLRNLEWNAHLAAISKGDFDIARLGFVAKFPDPLAIFQDMNVENFANGWHDEAFLKVYRAAQQESDLQRRMMLAHRCEQLFIDAMPVIPLYNLVNNQAVNPSLQGVVRNSTINYYLKGAWLDGSGKQEAGSKK